MVPHNRFCLYTPPLSTLQSYKEMVDYAAAHGIQKLETLNVLDLAAPDLTVARELKAYADAKGISFPCVSVGMSLVDDDREAAIQTMKRYADVAKILGSPYLHHTIALNFSDPQYIEENFELFYARGIAAVREIFDYAASIGIRTIFEDQGFLFNGRETFARFLKDVDRNVGVVADFGNIQFVDEDVEDFIPLYADRIVHVHLKDRTLIPYLPGEEGVHSISGKTLYSAPVGCGFIPVGECLSALKRLGYNGYMSAEFFGAADMRFYLRQSSENIDRMLSA